MPELLLVVLLIKSLSCYVGNSSSWKKLEMEIRRVIVER